MSSAQPKSPLCHICGSGLEFADVIMAEVSVVEVHKTDLGNWERTKMPIPKIVNTIPLAVMCSACGSQIEGIPVQIAIAVSSEDNRETREK